uniref:CATSPERE first N-terminal domain-containing protein n=1 Tax=Callorhinchus milii TaxID=7868 RepID=A0A4W3H8X6_CALMI
MGRAVCAALLLFARVGLIHGVWRYWTNMEGRVLFDTRNSINLEYEGDSFIQWVIPDSCVINSLRTPKAVLHCSKSGMHKIELRLKKKTPYDEPRYFRFEHAMFSFLWYMVKLPEPFRYG